MIHVTLLGTAALMPIPERALSSAALSCQTKNILFDCGEGTQAAARRWGVSLMKTDVIALTHYHGDHIFGLPGLLQSMHVLGREKPLTILGPGDIASELEPIMRLAGFTNYPVILMTAPECLELGSMMSLRAFPTVHRVPSVGYAFELNRAGKFLPEKARALGVPVTEWGRLQRGETVGNVRPEDVLGCPRRGLKVIFTGDTAMCPSLTSAAEGADLIISDATFASDELNDQANEYGHMTFHNAALTAYQAHAKRLWLTHYSQTIKTPEDELDRIQKIFPPTACGRDGMSITLRFEE